MWTLLGLAHAAAPIQDVFVASLIVPLAPGWATPHADQARDFWSRYGPVARPVEILRVAGNGSGGSFVGWVTVRDGAPRLAFAENPSDEARAEEMLQERMVRTSDGWRRGGNTLTILWAPTNTAVSPSAWSDWGRVELLTRFQGELYAEVAAADTDSACAALRALEVATDSGEPGALREAVRAVLAAPPPADDPVWRKVIAAAKLAGDTEAALTAHRYFRPVGFCSMDPSPENAARDYAATCRAAGRTGSALALYVRAMDYWGFERMAWSSSGEAATETGVDEIAAMGIDLPHFLLGLAYTFDGVDDINVSLQRLGRAIDESSQREAALAAFRAAAEDPALDEYNRLVVTIALFHASKGNLELAGASPSSSAWLALSSPAAP